VDPRPLFARLAQVDLPPARAVEDSEKQNPDRDWSSGSGNPRLVLGTSTGEQESGQSPAPTVASARKGLFSGSAPPSLSGKGDGGLGPPTRFEDCIECGLCVSACPVSGTDPLYWGPAALGAAARLVDEPRGRDPAPVLRAVDDEHGLWRCHGVFECTQVCPTGVDPGRLILALRGRLLGGG
jgi:ferredoxin